MKEKLGKMTFFHYFCRAMPPQYPIHNNLRGAFHLHQLLRPEFVMSYSKPLNPDSLSGFLGLGPNAEADNKIVCFFSRNLIFFKARRSYTIFI